MVNVTFLVRDRFRLTRQTLESFADATDGAEVIVTVLDDRSKRLTRDFIEGWCSTHNAAYIRNDIPLGTGPLRNVVIKSSGPRGDALYISDNDLLYKPDWLAMLIKCYDAAWDFGFKVVAAYNHPFNQPIPNANWVHLVKGGEYKVGDMIRTNGSIAPVYAVASQSMLMRWEVWDKFGPFVQTPVDRVCQSEDVAFCNKIREAGYHVGTVIPPLVASTGITNTFGEHIPGWEMVKKECPVGVLCE